MHEEDAQQIRQSLQDLGKTVANGLEGVRTEMNGYNRELGSQGATLDTQKTQIREIFERLNKPEEYCGLGKHLSKTLDSHSAMPHNGETPKAARPAVVAGTGAGAAGLMIFLVEIGKAVVAYFKAGGSTQ
jgi:hypothetical protein